jgi:predicted nuclease with TOPRIM domain
MMNLVRQHKGAASLVFANIGVAVSVLVGAVQFIATYQQTQADVVALTKTVSEVQQDLGEMRSLLASFEPQIARIDQDRELLGELDDRLDRLDDFVIRWDEQSSMIMAEHEQFSEIIKEVWEAIDERGTVPAGTNRTYGYD